MSEPNDPRPTVRASAVREVERLARQITALADAHDAQAEACADANTPDLFRAHKQFARELRGLLRE
jgi:hypothetical protein